MIVAYIVGGLLLLFFGMQLTMVLKMRANKGKPAPLPAGTLGTQIKRGDHLLLYFFSPGCPACRAMTPVVEKLGRGNSKVHAIDVSKDLLTARQFGVMGTPATVVVDAGTITEFLIGAQPDKLSALLQA